MLRQHLPNSFAALAARAHSTRVVTQSKLTPLAYTDRRGVLGFTTPQVHAHPIARLIFPSYSS